MAEVWIQRIGAAAGLATLAVALSELVRASRRPAGRVEGPAAGLQRWPIMVGATAVFFVVGWLLWWPLPIVLPGPLRLIATVVGAALYFPSLGLYLWGLRTLGAMFGAASGFGVRLYAGHRLVTEGPFSIVRHPMYAAVILAGLGGLLVYRTWSMLLFAVGMFGLVFRARREERALAAEFGESWREYASRVSAFVPRRGRLPHGPGSAGGRGFGKDAGDGEGDSR
jgi:protein-S-isoprenylcysteine O-methyltransferase Ste14